MSTEQTYPTTVLDDFWQFSVHNCQNNCSNHGSCHYGYCTCEDGWYGYDCSNSSCPGDFCYYDEETHEQVRALGFGRLPSVSPRTTTPRPPRTPCPTTSLHHPDLPALLLIWL